MDLLRRGMRKVVWQFIVGQFVFQAIHRHILQNCVAEWSIRCRDKKKKKTKNVNTYASILGSFVWYLFSGCVRAPSNSRTCICKCVCVCVFAFVFMCVVHVCACVCMLCMCARVVRVCVSLCACVCLCVCISACVCISFSAPLSVCLRSYNILNTAWSFFSVAECYNHWEIIKSACPQTHPNMRVTLTTVISCIRRHYICMSNTFDSLLSSIGSPFVS